jgi:hypothetical protein
VLSLPVPVADVDDTKKVAVWVLQNDVVGAGARERR